MTAPTWDELRDLLRQLDVTARADLGRGILDVSEAELAVWQQESGFRAAGLTAELDQAVTRLQHLAGRDAANEFVAEVDEELRQQRDD